MHRNAEDYRLMPGRRVAEHLLAAESASMRNETYEFPGGVRFPINNFDMNNDDHYPFPDDKRFCWNSARLMRGHKVFSDMISKWLDDQTLKHMKFLEKPDFVIDTKFKLTPRNQRQSDRGEELISPDAPDADAEPNQHANEAEQLECGPPEMIRMLYINNEVSAQPGRAASHDEDPINSAEPCDVDMELNIDPAANQAVWPNANATNAPNDGEGAQVPAVEQMEIDIDIDIDANINGNQANQDQNQGNNDQANDNQAEAMAHVPDYNNAADFHAAFIDPNAVPPVRRPFVPRPRQNLPQPDDDGNDFFQIDPPPEIGYRRRNRRGRNHRPIHRPIPYEDNDDFLNLLDFFENQLHGQPGRPLMPTEFDLPIPELSEELWPKDVDANPNQNIQNVENAEAQGFSPPPMDDPEIAGFESFENFQPVIESTPIRPAAQHERQPSGLEPILEVEVNPQDDHSNVLQPNVASAVQQVLHEATINDRSRNIHTVPSTVHGASAQMGMVGAEVAEQQNQMPLIEPAEVEIDQPNDQPVENNAEAERELIRAELARWRRNFYTGTNARNRASRRPIIRDDFRPEDFAVRRAAHPNDMVHPRLALEDMTEVYRLIHEYLSRPADDPVPIEEYLSQFPVGERFKALIGLADAVDGNSLLINVDANNQITGFRRVPDQ